MATDAEWERISRVAGASGMEISRYVVSRALVPEGLPGEVLRRAVREALVLSKLEERRLREAGAVTARRPLPVEQAAQPVPDPPERSTLVSHPH